MKLEAIAIKEKDKPLRVVNSGLFRDECDKLSPGRYRMTIDKVRRNKSQLQLGYLFSCVYPLFMKFANEQGWELTDVDEVDVFCKSQFANRNIINRHSGEVVTIPELKRNFTSTDMMTYIDKIRSYTAEYLGGYIPEPMEQTEMQYQ